MKKTAFKILYISAAMYVTALIVGVASYLLGSLEKKMNFFDYMSSYVVFLSKAAMVLAITVVIVFSCGHFFEKWYRSIFKS